MPEDPKPLDVPSPAVQHDGRRQKNLLIFVLLLALSLLTCGNALLFLFNGNPTSTDSQTAPHRNPAKSNP